MNPGPTKRILVVDNEPAATRMVRLALERYSVFEVSEVNDPRGALTAARLFKPDLVLLDIEMPGMDGSDVARQFRAEEGLQQTPIIFMTSLVTEEEAAYRIFAGGSRVLAKPITMAKLVRCVGDLLNTLIVTGGGEPAPAPAAVPTGAAAETYTIE